MDKSIEIQRQVRNNADDFKAYAKELNDWEAEMKERDKFLQKPVDNQDLPPVRSKKPRAPKEQKVVTPKPKAQHYSCDYSNWEKFDVEGACKEVDKSSSEESEDEEVLIAESAARAEELKQKAQIAAKEKANIEKVKGNEFVKQGKWDQAIKCYTRAINLCEGDAIFYANRGLCHLKKENWFDAETDCTASLNINPGYVKALQRRGTALAAQGKLVEAVADLSQVVKIEPRNVQAKKQIEELEKKIMKTNIAEDAKLKEIGKKSESLNSKKTEVKNTHLKDVIEHNKNSESEDNNVLTDWSTGSCGDGSVLVYPIRKPPHLRSKKPLKRIEIQEIISQNIKKRSPHTAVHSTTNSLSQIVNTERKMENTAGSSYIDNKLNDIDTKDKKDLINNIKVGEIKTEHANEVAVKIDTNLISNLEDTKYETPATSVQFYNDWNLFKNNPAQRFEMLKCIPGSKFRTFFGLSLESSVLSEMLTILKDNFVSLRLPVWNYLQGIANLSRFYSLRMFMSTTDIEAIKYLFDYCKQHEEATDEQISCLKQRYELN